MHKLVLLGELDRASTATLEAVIEGLCERQVEGITLDLSELSYIDATGVAVIAFRWRWCERRGCQFAIVPGPPAVQQVFELTGASARLPFVAPEPPVVAPPEHVSLHAGAAPSALAVAHASARVQRQVLTCADARTGATARG